MAYQAINIGSVADDGTGDTLRSGGDKVNDNFVELYTLLGTGSALTSGISSNASTVTLSTPVIDGTVSGTAIKDEDDLVSDSSTHLATQQSIKAYVDTKASTLAELTDTNITSPNDAGLLLYDTGTSTWRDADMSGDVTISNTGVTTIQSGAVSSTELASVVTLIIYDSSGTPVKTLYGAGS